MSKKNEAKDLEDDLMDDLAQLNKDFPFPGEDEVEQYLNDSDTSIDEPSDTEEAPAKKQKNKNKSSVASKAIGFLVSVLMIIIILLAGIIILNENQIDENTPVEYIDQVKEVRTTAINTLGMASKEIYLPIKRTIDIVSQYIGDLRQSRLTSVEAQPKAITEEPVVVAQPKAITEEPVVVAQPKAITEEPVVVAQPKAITEEPVVVAQPKEITEEPVVVAQTKAITEEPVVVAQPKAITEEPVVVAQPKAITEEPVVVAKPEFSVDLEDQLKESINSTNQSLEEAERKVDLLIRNFDKVIEDAKKQTQEAIDLLKKKNEYLEKQIIILKTNQLTNTASIKDNQDAFISSEKKISVNLDAMDLGIKTAYKQQIELTSAVESGSVIMDRLSKQVAAIEAEKEISISDFMEYEMLGFDKANKSVWVKDRNNNIIKLQKGDYLSEYGLVLSISDDATVVTKSGVLRVIASEIK